MAKRFFLLALMVASAAGCQSMHKPAEEAALPVPVFNDWQVAENSQYCFPDDGSTPPPSAVAQHQQEQPAAEIPSSAADVAKTPVVNQPPADSTENPYCPYVTLWSRMQVDFQMEYVDEAAVRQQMDWYLSRPDYMQRVQMRASRYLHHIMNRLKEHELPPDLALLPIVESAYEPFAYSRSKASGLWQFIPGTGKHFGLQQDWWYDGRRDAVESTDAAISYLKYLHDYFDGDWHLALAAYNAGEGTVRRAIEKNRKKGLETDFWHLDLPAETRAYVPKLIALVEIFRNPDKYAFALLPIADRPYFGEVKLDSQMDISQAAKLSGIDMEEIAYLNPGLKRMATPPADGFTLKLPIYAIDAFKDAMETLTPEQRVTWQHHTIRKGETLGSIAKKYHTDKQSIRSANQLKSDKIVTGKTLVIPSAIAGSAAIAKGAPKTSTTEYRVKPGETFWRIAQNHGVDMETLAKWNHRSPNDPLKVGEVLTIRQLSGSNASGGEQTKLVRYKVKKGDSLAKVASRFNIKIPQLVAWNGIDPDKYLKLGQPLTIYVNTKTIR